jgi:hypothetical protein
MKLTQSDFYFCYSRPLKEFLLGKGLRFIVTANNNSTGKQFWMFQKDNELSQYLTEWSSR